METKTIRVVRDGDGGVLMKWALAPTALICDECGDPISAFASVAVRQVPYPSYGRVKHATRHYCKSCGDLLEDSLVTTEAR